MSLHIGSYALWGDKTVKVIGISGDNTGKRYHIQYSYKGVTKTAAPESQYVTEITPTKEVITKIAQETEQLTKRLKTKDPAATQSIIEKLHDKNPMKVHIIEPKVLEPAIASKQSIGIIGIIIVVYIGYKLIK